MSVNMGIVNSGSIELNTTMKHVPIPLKNAKDTFENGLVFQKMKTEEVVELDEKEQIEVKAGDILGKLGVYSYDWIEEPVVHLEVFTFDGEYDVL